MTYKEWRDKRQAEFNALPIFFAFNNEHFKREMEKRGLTEEDTDKIYKFGNNCFYLREDADKIREFVLDDSHNGELERLMQDEEFAIDAFIYEMSNHEYSINWQGDFDVCNALCKKEPEYDDSKTYKDYLREDHHEEWIPLFEKAKKLYYKKENENE